MKTLKLIILTTVLISFNAVASIVVVVHPSSTIASLSQDEVQRIFLGKTKKFPNGDQAVPVNQDEGQAIRDTFNQKVCSKDSGQYRAYWSKLIFTGKGAPPKEVENDAEVKDLVAKNPNIIGYIDSSQVDASVKVVFTIE